MTVGGFLIARAKNLMLCTAVGLGLFQTWVRRYAMNPDGISYLDIADAFFRADWDNAVSSYWSPFYPVLLGLGLNIFKSSANSEFEVVHVVNFLIYLFTLGCFRFLLHQLIQCSRERTGSSEDGELISEPALTILGYTLFIWSSLGLITIAIVSPDMLLAGFMYLATGVLLWIRRGQDGVKNFVFLGVILGFGYLTKSPMLPLALVFLALSMFSLKNLRKALLRTGIAFVAFMIIASPLVGAISHKKGRLTFSEAGRLTYAWHVNGVTKWAHWQGGPAGSGTPFHPTRKIFIGPDLYEFGTPISGTYPPWFDPTYWYDGLTHHIDVKKQVEALFRNSKSLLLALTMHGGNALLVGLLVLCIVGRKSLRGLRHMAEQSVILIPAIAGLGMYMSVTVASRYIGVFLVLLWLGVFSAIRLPRSDKLKELWTGVSAAISVVIIGSIGIGLVRQAYDLRKTPADVQWEVANGLKQIGIRPGDEVANIGFTFGAYWARLARVRVVAEIPKENAVDFWKASQSLKLRIYESFRKTGAKVIVTETFPSYGSASGWVRIGRTDHYAYLLGKPD